MSTPIGNLADISLRALRTLASVEWVLAEDTRRAATLLSAYGIKARVKALHQHNEERNATHWVEEAQSLPIAIISDAGTPLLSDPGLPLVKKAIEAGVEVIPVPGASALLSAAVVTGFAMDHMQFLGFLPHKGSGRRGRIERAERSGGALVIYEAPGRVGLLLSDLQAICGDDRQLCISREMTKLHEQHFRGCVVEAMDWLEESSDHSRGEFVVVVEGGGREEAAIDADKILRALAKELPPSKAAKVASDITGIPRRELFSKLNPDKD